jgi:tRNA isopentenyl-2-thiomethyl-A-37 hydroxylase MiaE
MTGILTQVRIIVKKENVEFVFFKASPYGGGLEGAFKSYIK